MNEAMLDDLTADLRVELRCFALEQAIVLRKAALSAVVRWAWSEIGVPGVGDLDADLRGGTPFRWIELTAPDPDEPAYGLDVAGRVRISLGGWSEIEQIFEYSPTRIRILMLDGAGRVRALDDLTVEDGQYRFAISASETSIGYRRYDYDGDRLISIAARRLSRRTRGRRRGAARARPRSAECVWASRMLLSGDAGGSGPAREGKRRGRVVSAGGFPAARRPEPADAGVKAENSSARIVRTANCAGDWLMAASLLLGENVAADRPVEHHQLGVERAGGAGL